MPAIRIMNWNIRKMSNRKLLIPGMTNAIARTVAAQNVDVLVILEVTMMNRVAAMTALSNALNAADPGLAATNWQGWFLSYQAGGEFYGVIIRDLDMIRPTSVTLGPPAATPWGSRFDPLSDLKKYGFCVWPSPNFAATAYPVPVVRPQIPLIIPFSRPIRDRQAKRQRTYAGQPAALGGYSQGRGYRLPMMLLLWIHTALGDYMVPVVACHYAAAGYQAAQQTILARAQIGQTKEFHIAQMFNSDPTNVAGISGYLAFQVAVGGAYAPVRVQELCFTGDFNVDFLQNLFGWAAPHASDLNRHAYDAITPTQQQGGSAVGAATPGVPGPVPVVPYAPPFAPAPQFDDIWNQRLHTAVTTQGTILRQYPIVPPPPVAPPPAPYVSYCFDNFIYGGTQLNTAVPGFGVPAIDTGDVDNIPANVACPSMAPFAPGVYDAGPIAGHYAPTNTWSTGLQPNLQSAAVPPPVLTDNDRLVGANIVSDHLPVVLQFNCP